MVKEETHSGVVTSDGSSGRRAVGSSPVWAPALNTNPLVDSDSPSDRRFADRIHQHALCRETLEHLRFGLEPELEPSRNARYSEVAHPVPLSIDTPCRACPPPARPILPRWIAGGRCGVRASLWVVTELRHGQAPPCSPTHAWLTPPYSRRRSASGISGELCLYVAIEPGRE